MFIGISLILIFSYLDPISIRNVKIDLNFSNVTVTLVSLMKIREILDKTKVVGYVTGTIPAVRLTCIACFSPISQSILNRF